MASYKVLVPLKHDGKQYNPGDVVELDKVLADNLLQSGAVEKTTATAKSTAKDEK